MIWYRCVLYNSSQSYYFIFSSLIVWAISIGQNFKECSHHWSYHTHHIKSHYTTLHYTYPKINFTCCLINTNDNLTTPLDLAPVINDVIFDNIPSGLEMSIGGGMEESTTYCGSGSGRGGVGSSSGSSSDSDEYYYITSLYHITTLPLPLQ